MNNSEILTSRACGKFILIGEHFAVAGVPAIAFPLSDLQTHVSLQKGLSVDENILPAVKLVRERLEIVAPWQVNISSNIPFSRGLGSSASFAVALTRAFAQCSPLTLSEKTLSDLIFDVESIYHGTPSGIDTTVVSLERAIRFKKGETQHPPVYNRAVDFVVIDSGARESCASLVREVSERRNAHPDWWKNLADVMTDLVFMTQEALARGDSKKVAEAVQQSGKILEELGLYNDAVQRAVDGAKAAGARAAKVSGAGRGGVVVCVTDPGCGEAVAKNLSRHGFSVVAFRPCEQP